MGLENSELSAFQTSPLGRPERKMSRGLKTLIFISEIVFVLGLLIWWLTSDASRKSLNLLVLFFYCFPAEFIIATVPHEPVLLFFSRFYEPLNVALVSIAGTALTEIVNYSVFGYVVDLKIFQKMVQNRTVGKMVKAFAKAPFLALWVAGFTPIPFYPFRFLVVLARYPLWKYILAVITSRTPRFFLLALLGKSVRFSNTELLALLVVLILAANYPLVRKILLKKRTRRSAPGQTPPQP